MNRIKDYIHEGKVDSALNLCRSTNTPSARMIEKAYHPPGPSDERRACGYRERR